MNEEDTGFDEGGLVPSAGFDYDAVDRALAPLDRPEPGGDIARVRQETILRLIQFLSCICSRACKSAWLLHPRAPAIPRQPKNTIQAWRDARPAKHGGA